MPSTPLTSASRPSESSPDQALTEHQREDAARLRAFATFDFSLIVSCCRLASGPPPFDIYGVAADPHPRRAYHPAQRGGWVCTSTTDRIITWDRAVIGESALPHGEVAFLATVTTTGAAEVLRIGRDDLARLLDGSPPCRATIDDGHPACARRPPPSRERPNHAALRVHLVPTEVVSFEHAAQVAGVRSRTPWRRAPSGRSATAATPPPADG